MWNLTVLCLNQQDGRISEDQNVKTEVFFKDSIRSVAVLHSGKENHMWCLQKVVEMYSVGICIFIIKYILIKVFLLSFLMYVGF